MFDEWQTQKQSVSSETTVLLTVLCPGVIRDTEASFKFLSSPCEYHINVVSSCGSHQTVSIDTFKFLEKYIMIVQRKAKDETVH